MGRVMQCGCGVCLLTVRLPCSIVSPFWGQYRSHLTRPFSFKPVIITTISLLCSQIIRLPAKHQRADE